MESGVWEILNPDNPVLVRWLQCVAGDKVEICSAEPVEEIRNKDYIKKYYKLHYLLVKPTGICGSALMDELLAQDMTDICYSSYDPYYDYDADGNPRDVW